MQTKCDASSVSAPGGLRTPGQVFQSHHISLGSPACLFFKKTFHETLPCLHSFTLSITWLAPDRPIVQNNEITRVMWPFFHLKQKFCLYSPGINECRLKGVWWVGLTSHSEGMGEDLLPFFGTLSLRHAISALHVSVMDQRRTLQVSSSSLIATQSMASDKWKCTAWPRLSSQRLYNRDATQGQEKSSEAC